jgi:hypothetical protein
VSRVRRAPARALLAALLVTVALGACSKKKNTVTAPEPGGGGPVVGDVCSGASPFQLAGYRWAVPSPSFAYSTSLPSTWRPSVDAGAATWNGAGSSLRIVKQTTIVGADVAKDNRNVVCFGSLPSGVLGTTYTWYSTGTGLISEADIKLSSTASMSVGGSRTSVDVQSVITHEFGHFAGLDHVTDVTHTMYSAIPANSTIYRTLCDGDVAGVRNLYP